MSEVINDDGLKENTNALNENSLAMATHEIVSENVGEGDISASASMEQATQSLERQTEAYRRLNTESQKTLLITDAINTAMLKSFANTQLEQNKNLYDLSGSVSKYFSVKTDSQNNQSVILNDEISSVDKRKFLKNGGQELLDNFNVDLKVSEFVRQQMNATLDEILRMNLKPSSLDGLEKDLVENYSHLKSKLLGKALNELQNGKDIRDINLSNLGGNSVLQTSLGIQQKYSFIGNQNLNNNAIWEASLKNQDAGKLSNPEIFHQMTSLFDDFEKTLQNIENNRDIVSKSSQAKVALKSLEDLFDMYSEIDPQDTSDNLKVFEKNFKFLNETANSYRPSSFETSINTSSFREDSQRMFEDIKVMKDLIEEQRKIEEESLNQRREAFRAQQEAINMDAKSKKEYVSKYLENLNEKMDTEDDTSLRKFRDSLAKVNALIRTISSIEDSPFATVSEISLKNSMRNISSVIGTYGWAINEDGEDELIAKGKLGNLGIARTNMLNFYQAMQDPTLSAQEIEIKQKAFNQASNEYQKQLLDITSYLQNANSTLSEGINLENKRNKAIEDENQTIIKNTSKNNGNNRNNTANRLDYDSYKYALVRNDLQQDDFSRDYPRNFSTTGNLYQSFLKTVFNKSVGYRQRQGIVGMAANIGYNSSGTLLSTSLGLAATALKKFTDQVISFTKESFNAYGELEKIRTNLGIVYSSKSEADTTFSEIAAYSVKSPFGVQTVSEYAVLLKQSGIYASDLMTTLKQIGDVAGGNQQKFANIANAFSQIEANGKATTRQLRQFATAGIPIYKELSNELGVSVDKIRKMTEEGKITNKVIEKVFKNLTGPGGTFENAVNIGAKTWEARLQNLSDTRQLAQDALGNYLINYHLGSNGTQNTVPKSFLDLSENFYNKIKEIFDNWSNKKIEKLYVDTQYTNKLLRSTDGKSLEVTELLNNIKNNNGVGDEEIRNIRSQRYISARNSINTAKVNENMLKNLLDVYENGIEGASKELNKALKKEIEKSYPEIEMVANFWVYSLLSFIPFIGGIFQSKISRGSLLSTRGDSSPLVDKEVFDDFNNDKYKNAYFSQQGSAYARAAKDYLSKLNDEDNSIVKLSSKIDSLYENTETGKKEKELEGKKQIDELIRQSKLEQKIGLVVDKIGTTISGFTWLNNGGTLEQNLKLLKSDVVVGDRYDLSPEKITEQTIKDIQSKASAFAPLFAQIYDKYSYNTVTQTQNPDGTISYSNQKVSSVFDFTELLNQLINPKELYDETGNRIGLDLENISITAGQIADALKKIDGKIGSDELKTLFSIIFSNSTNQGLNYNRLLTIQEEQNKKDTYPLWQRILNQSFGTSLELFRNGAITRGDQAVNIWNSQQQKETIRNVASQMLSRMSYKDVMKNIRYDGRQAIIGNNSRDGTRQISWDKTYKEFQKFALSMESATEVTQAFSDSLNNQLDTINEFEAMAFTTMESPENIYDKEYQKHLGELSEKIKALDANAYDMMFTETADGLLLLRENATSAAEALKNQVIETAMFTDLMSGFKNATQQNEEATDTDMTIAKYYLGGFNNSAMLKNLRPDLVDKALTYITSLTQDESFKKHASMMGVDINTLREALILGGNTTYQTRTPVGLSKEEQAQVSNAKDILDKAIADLQDFDAKAINNIKSIGKQQGKFNDLEGAARDKALTEWAERWAFTDNNPNTLSAHNEKVSAVENAKISYNELLDSLEAKTKDNFKTEEHDLEIKIGSESFKASDAVNQYLNSELDQDAASDLKDIAKNVFELVSRTKDGYTTARNPLLTALTNTDIYGKNSFSQQKILNRLGKPEGYQFSTLVNRYNNEIGRNSVQAMIDNSLTEEQKNYGLENFGSDLTDSDVLAQWLKYILKIKIASEDVSNTVTNLGKNLRNTFESSILSGFNNTMVMAGNHVNAMIKGTYDASEAGEDYANIWKDVGQSMLSSMGPAVTQAGLAIITQDPKNWKAGLALIAAGGILNFMSGLFGDDDKDKDKQQEERLKNLKDLLSDLIEQAKTDAEYYEKNFRHENALSQANQISVNDAIISPNGNVISTAPDDYLIATKTPGSLVGGKGTTVNFTVVNNSSNVAVKEERKNNPDGTVDIIATIVDVVSGAVADGTMDEAFAARDYRLNGQSYAY